MNRTIFSVALLCSMSVGALSGTATAASDDVLNVGVKQGSFNFNPYLAITQDSYQINENLYYSLLDITPDGRLVPAIAASWEASDDLTQYRFQLRPDAAWSDGTPITAEAVVEGYNRLKELGIAERMDGNITPEFSVDDEGWVVADYPVPVLDAEWRFAAQEWAPMPVHLADQIDFSADWTTGPDEHMVFSGPYQLTHSDDMLISLRPNPHYYHADRVFNDGVDVHLDANFPAATLAKFRQGVLDAAYLDEALQPQVLQALPDDSYTFNEAKNVILLMFNNARAPFDDVRLRQALALAAHLPSEGVFENNHSIRAAHSVVLDEFAPLYESLPAEWASWSQEERFAKARALMAELGYNDQNRLSLSFQRPAVGATGFRSHHLLRSQWSQIYVDTKVEMLAFSDLIQSMVAGDYETLEISWNYNTNSPFDALDMLRSNSDFNVLRHQNDDYDAMIKAMGSAQDDTTRNAISLDLQAYLNREVPYYPLYSVNNLVLKNPELILPEGSFNFMFSMSDLRYPQEQS